MIAIVGAIAVGLVVGGLTAYAQGWLSNATTSLANSAGPWATAAFLVACYNRRLLTAIVAAMATLACCELGYAIATVVRGDSNSATTVAFWLIAAVLAGPPLGIAAAWSTREGIRHGIGFAVIGGVLIGEGTYGWTTVADTTDWRYWAVELLIGVIVVAAAAFHRKSTLQLLATVGTGALTAMVVFVVAKLA